MDQTSKKKLKQGTLLFSDLFSKSKPGYTALNKPVSEEDILDFHSSLMDADHKCGTAWVISPTLELNDKSGLPSFVRDLLHLDVPSLKEELTCSEEQIKKVEEQTRDQRNNPLLSKLRHLRLAASCPGELELVHPLLPKMKLMGCKLSTDSSLMTKFLKRLSMSSKQVERKNSKQLQVNSDACTPPHQPVTTDTIACWIRGVLQKLELIQNCLELTVFEELEKTEKAKRWLHACGRKNFCSLSDIKKDICTIYLRGKGPTDDYPDPVLATLTREEVQGRLIHGAKRLRTKQARESRVLGPSDLNKDCQEENITDLNETGFQFEKSDSMMGTVKDEDGVGNYLQDKSTKTIYCKYTLGAKVKTMISKNQIILEATNSDSVKWSPANLMSCENFVADDKKLIPTGAACFVLDLFEWSIDGVAISRECGILDSVNTRSSIDH
eukprot:gene7364-13100_t